ncbi:response regulator [Candidatus Omnitrophota bacterium]
MAQHILIVDDEPQFARMLEMLLQSHNFKTTIARNGQEALSKINQNHNLVLLDRSLPDIDGLEVCRLIRENQKYSLTPIIFLSASDSTEEISDGLYIGADDYITKPFQTKELFARINAALRRNRNINASKKEFSQKLFLELTKILHLKSITSFFQPIFTAESLSPVGLEAQSHAPVNSPLSNMNLLVEASLKTGLFHELETLCWSNAISKWESSTAQHNLFLKCCTLCFNNNHTPGKCFLEKNNITEKNITLQISGKTPINNKTNFFKRLNIIKNNNIKIVLEHFEDSALSLRDIGDISPHYLKCNYSAVRNIKSNSLRLKIMERTNNYCRKRKIQTIFNNIQNSNELTSAIITGTNNVQGDYICKPHHRIETLL